MIDLNPLISEVRAVIAATWPEVLPDGAGGGGGGILEAEHADMVPWSDLALPYAVILIEDVPLSGLAALDELCFAPKVCVFFTDRVRGASTGIRDKLQSLIAAFWPADPLTVGQLLDVPRLEWSNALLPNQVLAAKNASARAGVVVLDVLVTEPD